MESVFFDIDTQVDFIDPNGALYVPGSQDIAPNIRRLLEHATHTRTTTLSPVCAHVVDDPEFKQFGPHCLEGTPGQRRYFDDLPRLPRTVWAAEVRVAAADVTIEPGRHYVLAKRTFPMFANPWMRALREQGAFRGLAGVAFGVATDVCVLRDVLDLCQAGARIRVVRDAIAGINAEDSARALQQMQDAGAVFTTTNDIVKA